MSFWSDPPYIVAKNLNNPAGDRISETRSNRIDGGWLENGDYDRAFKGYPAPKQINIFMGGGVYQQPSWKSTLLTGGIALGIQGLGLWFMSKLFGRNKAQITPQTQSNMGLNGGVQGNYWTNYFSNWRSPFTFSPATANTATTGTQTKKTETPPVDTGKKAKETPEDKKVEKTGDANGPAAAEFTAEATNKRRGTEPISGKVVSDGKYEGEHKYPQTFTIYDPKHSGQEKPNEYTFTFTGRFNNNQPIYRCSNAKVASKENDPPTFNKDIEFTVSKGFVEDKETGKYKIGDNIEMNSDDAKSVIDDTGKLVGADSKGAVIKKFP